MSNYWLSEVVMTVVDYLQKDMKSNYFVKQVGKPGKPGPKLKFRFANTSTALDPEMLLSTAETNVPFLLFSTAAHKHRLREYLANTFIEVCQSRKRIDEVASINFEIDPFDVACLIAIAQGQAFQFRTSNLSEIPTHFMVHLITPNPLTPASLHLYTAEISRIYLEAMENLDIKLEEGLTISREVVEIPSSYKNLREGALVERLGEILERCHESMRVLQEERDLERKVRKHVRFWKPIKAGNGAVSRIGPWGSHYKKQE
ncbi:hypothetical protein Q9L58_007181 [Maublancomyces gigas]|uniref:Uncharacterized protein n=1 Tax=Discina gigas TaxID=1032678 RepID=A0ABR3GD44_9PEZI